MDAIRYIVTIGAGFFGLAFICLNWAVYIKWIFMRKQMSGMPFIGGILLCIAFVIVPNNPYWRLCWLAFVIDISALPWLIIGKPYAMIKNSPKKQKKYLAERINLMNSGLENERDRKRLISTLFIGCIRRSWHIKRFSEYLSWEDFYTQYLEGTESFKFAYKNMLLLLAGDDLGYYYILECMERVIESKSFSSRQELLDNIRIDGKTLQEIWDDLR